MESVEFKNPKQTNLLFLFQQILITNAKKKKKKKTYK